MTLMYSIILSALFAWLEVASPRATSPLQVTAQLSQEAPGSQVYVAVYHQEQYFLQEKNAYKVLQQPVGEGKSITFAINDLPSGTYAIAFFHDLNGNKKLDTNVFGVPTEPYGFSRNARPRFRAPNWAETHFAFDGKTTKAITVQLKKW